MTNGQCNGSLAELFDNDGTQSSKITWSSEESWVVRSSIWEDLLPRRLSLDPFPVVFSSTQVFFQLICTFVPLLAVQIICPAVSPVCYANAWLPLRILPPHPLVRHLHCHYLSPACISTPARDPAYFDSARQFRPLRYFSLDDYVSCWINVLIWW